MEVQVQNGTRSRRRPAVVAQAAGRQFPDHFSVLRCASEEREHGLRQPVLVAAEEMVVESALDQPLRAGQLGRTSAAALVGRPRRSRPRTRSPASGSRRSAKAHSRACRPSARRGPAASPVWPRRAAAANSRSCSRPAPAEPLPNAFAEEVEPRGKVAPVGHLVGDVRGRPELGQVGSHVRGRPLAAADAAIVEPQSRDAAPGQPFRQPADDVVAHVPPSSGCGPARTAAPRRPVLGVGQLAFQPIRAGREPDRLDGQGSSWASDGMRPPAAVCGS